MSNVQVTDLERRLREYEERFAGLRDALLEARDCLREWHEGLDRIPEVDRRVLESIEENLADTEGGSHERE